MGYLQRRYYVVSEDVVEAHRDLFHAAAGITWLPLYDASVPGDRERWEAAGKPVLLNAIFRHEILQDRWHSHPEVAILPHPLYEGNHPLQSHVGKPNRKLASHHIAALGTLGVTGEHTVLELEEKALARNRGMKLRAVL